MFIKKIMPSISDLKKQRGLTRVGELAEKKPYLFVLRRRKVALGFSIGMAWGVIPLPIQVFASLFTCYLFKANIPAAVVAAFLTNPLTSPFILAISYYVGSLVVIPNNVTAVFPALTLLLESPLSWLDKSADYFSDMGETILVGIPLTSALFGLISYLLVSCSWKLAVMNHRKKILLARKNKIESDLLLESPKDITIS